MSGTGGHVCAARGCKNRRSLTKESFFTFPKDVQRARRWVVACGREDLLDNVANLHKGYRLCGRHFEAKVFLNDLRNRLQPYAIPTSFPSSGSSLVIEEHNYTAPAMAKASADKVVDVELHMTEEDPLSISQECENSTRTFNLTSEEDIKTEEIESQATTENEINIQSIAEEPALSTRFLLGSGCELLPKTKTKLQTLLESDVPKAKNVQVFLLNYKVHSHAIHDGESVTALHVDEELHSIENTRNVLVEKFDKICRICFSQNKLEPFFSLQFEGRFLHDIYTKLTSIATNVADKLPDYICKDCIETLTKTFIFVQRCQESYKLLQEIVSNHDFNLAEKNNDAVLEESNINYSEINFDNLIKADDTVTSNLNVSTNIDNISTIKDIPNEIEDNGSTREDPPGVEFLDMDTISKERFEISSVISEKLPPFSCKGCLRRFHNALQLQMHILQNKPCRQKRNQGRLKVYQCSDCKTTFSSAHQLEKHMIRVHPKVKLYRCDICSEEYRYHRSLRRHQKNHEQRARQRLLREKMVQESEDLHLCTVCNEAFTSLQDLNQHMEIHISDVDVDVLSKPSSKCPKNEIMENGMKQWLCSQCPKTFKTKSKLYNHEQDHIEGKLNHTSQNHTTSLCTICGKLFNKSQGFWAHMRSHADSSKKVVCKLCKKEFANSQNLSKHMNQHNGIKRHLCSTCGKAFTQHCNLVSHTKTHDELKPYFCHLCNKKFRGKSNIKIHLRLCKELNSLISTEAPPFSCKTCARDFDTVKEFLVHNLDNRRCRPKTHHCHICKSGFQSSSKLKIHMRAHSKEQPYECDICRERFRYRGNLTRHEKVHQKKAQQRLLREKISQKSENLNSCNEAFTSYNDLKQQKESHVNAISYQCEKCGTTCATSGSLQRHSLYYCLKNVRKKDSTKQWQCSQCPRSFKYKIKLYYHEQGHVEGKQTETKTYLCPDCGKLFNNKSVFWTHQKIHTGSNKNAVCEVCNKEFTTSGSLYLHMKIHSGIKDFVCTICEKAFTQKPHLLNHYKVHADLKPFSCQICNRKFREKGNLTQHLRTCTGITPFHCLVCGKGLSSSTSLKKHMEIHQ